MKKFKGFLIIGLIVLSLCIINLRPQPTISAEEIRSLSIETDYDIKIDNQTMYFETTVNETTVNGTHGTVISSAECMANVSGSSWNKFLKRWNINKLVSTMNVNGDTTVKEIYIN